MGAWWAQAVSAMSAGRVGVAGTEDDPLPESGPKSMDGAAGPEDGAREWTGRENGMPAGG